MTTLFESPVLVSTSSVGAEKFWRIRVIKDEANGVVYTTTESWHKLADGSDSKHVHSAPKYMVQRNVGKKNETTLEEQGLAEAASDVQLKKDKGYWVYGEKKPVSLALPMLAHKFAERGQKMQYPAAVQPKLDGVRCLMDGTKAWSRQGNPFDPKVVEHILFDTGGFILDGELMLPQDEFTFQESIAAIKKYRPELSPKLEYHVYDIVDTSMSFLRRHAQQVSLAHKGVPPNVKFVPTTTAANAKEVAELHEKYASAGFEGVMVRNWQGHYKLKDRSSDLLKLKDFHDAEYKIVDVAEGLAKHMGCAIFVCETANPTHKYGDGPCPTDRTCGHFRATPKATVPERKRMYANRKSLVGKVITVTYQNLYDDGTPRFPIAKQIRDYE